MPFLLLFLFRATAAAAAIAAGAASVADAAIAGRGLLVAAQRISVGCVRFERIIRQKKYSLHTRTESLRHSAHVAHALQHTGGDPPLQLYHFPPLLPSYLPMGDWATG